MSVSPSLILSVFLDECKKLIDYIIWLFIIACYDLRYQQFTNDSRTCTSFCFGRRWEVLLFLERTFPFYIKVRISHTIRTLAFLHLSNAHVNFFYVLEPHKLILYLLIDLFCSGQVYFVFTLYFIQTRKEIYKSATTHTHARARTHTSIRLAMMANSSCSAPTEYDDFHAYLNDDGH